jgi:hypothetical protein
LAVHRYDARDVESQAVSILGERADEVLHGPRATLGPPRTKGPSDGTPGDDHGRLSAAPSRSLEYLVDEPPMLLSGPVNPPALPAFRIATAARPGRSRRSHTARAQAKIAAATSRPATYAGARGDGGPSPRRPPGRPRPPRGSRACGAAG